MKRSRLRPYARASPAAICALLAASLASRPLAAADEPIFGESIEVSEVSVPVRVWKRGEPVRDLVAADFVLLDRGRRQEIVGFEVIERDRQLPVPGSGDTTAAAAAPVLDPASQRNLLLLFDFHRLAGASAGRAVAGVRELLARSIASGDRWGIAVHGITVAGDRNMSARLMLGFTDDRARLEQGLAVVEALFARQPRRASSLLAALARGRDTLDVLRSGRPQDTFGGLEPSAALTLLATGARRGSRTGRFEVGVPLGWLGVEAPETLSIRDTDDSWFGKSSKVLVSDGSAESRLRWFAYAMADLATFLRDLPGDNHLVLLSAGGYGVMSDSFTTSRMKPMLAAFRRAGWTFQAIDARGRGFRSGDMFYMANETGGTLVENVANIAESLARVRAESDVTYRLSFLPDRSEADGAYHRLEVRLRDKSQADRIRHRTGYFAEAPRSERSALDLRLDQMRAILGPDERNDIEIDVSFGAIPAAGVDQRASVPITVLVDGPSLLARHDRAFVTVKIEGYALGERGDVLDLFVDEATIDLAAVGYLAGNRLTLRRALSLPAGSHRIRIWVENVETAALTLRTTTIVVPAG